MRPPWPAGGGRPGPGGRASAGPGASRPATMQPTVAATKTGFAPRRTSHAAATSTWRTTSAIAIAEIARPRSARRRVPHPPARRRVRGARGAGVPGAGRAGPGVPGDSRGELRGRSHADPVEGEAGADPQGGEAVHEAPAQAHRARLGEVAGRDRDLADGEPRGAPPGRRAPGRTRSRPSSGGTGSSRAGAASTPGSPCGTPTAAGRRRGSRASSGTGC